ncbi:MAG TPA: MFS transporter [Aestuariivirga sp.]|nr:MFS transporter [Aestuariivirga sp.]
MAVAREGPLLALLAFGNFIVGMGAFVVIGIVTPIAEGFGVSKASAGMVLTTYAIAYALLSPIGAAITGNLARRTVLVSALTLFLLGSIGSALSSSITMLAASRIVVALGAAMFTPIAAGVAVAVSSPEGRGKALATVFGGVTLAQVVGVPFGAWMAYRFGWASTFWAVAGLAVMGVAVLFFAIPRDVRFQAAGVQAILAAMKDRHAMFATAFTATFITAIYIVFTFFGPLIEASIGSNPEIRTGFLVLFGLGAVAGNYAGGFLTDRIGGKSTLIIICIAQALIMPMFSIIPLAPLVFAVLVGVWSAFGWSFMAPQQSRLAAIAPEAISLVLALNAAMIYVGIALGSAAASYILDWKGLAALGISGGLAVLLALAHLLLSGRSKALRGRSA